LVRPGGFQEVKMSTKGSPKSHKIAFLKGKVADSARANPGDDKASRSRVADQATSPSSDGGATSPESGNRKNWVGWNDWDAIRTH
jgi:hypothetical protein